LLLPRAVAQDDYWGCANDVIIGPQRATDRCRTLEDIEKVAGNEPELYRKNLVG
jgi:hypothetical protein